MKLIAAFLKLIRWPNLLMIAVTQLLFYFSLVEPLAAKGINTSFNKFHFLLLIIASVLVAAAGYIINDYFDLNIDQVNKPERTVIDKLIKRRWAIVMHLGFSLAAIVIGFYVDLNSTVFWLGLSNIGVAFLLFGYSISLKKKLLWGNILVSALTGWVVLISFLCYYNTFTCSGCGESFLDMYNNRFIRISFLYSGFAFIISIIREVVKDLEDIDGDARYGCKTMPIAWGIPASKVFVAVWLVVLIGMVGIVQFYVLQFGWIWSAVYCIILIILPLLWILRNLMRAQVPKDYRQLSGLIKLVMLAGLLSMIFFKIYS
ncbi:MAG: geranylgeranylglycerol-phosphate geranylgeranyltransferase [Chitinophagaceae bacterium]|nr:geranylgeranylglycerol-phosphate geranylgeranyltransferase [Chitinophagaceae bacterium]